MFSTFSVVQQESLKDISAIWNIVRCFVGGVSFGNSFFWNEVVLSVLFRLPSNEQRYFMLWETLYEIPFEVSDSTAYVINF